MCPEVEFSEYFNCNRVDESTARNDFSGPVKDYCNQRITFRLSTRRVNHDQLLDLPLVKSSLFLIIPG